MNNVWNWIRSMFAALGGAIGWFMGGFDGFFYMLVAFCILDYITGLIAAGVEKKLNSEVGFQGIAKKLAIFILVGIGHLIDQEILGNTAVLRTAVIFFYLSNVAIYTSTWWLNHELDKARLAPYDIWLAQWSKTTPTERHGIWQYTSQGLVPGYSGRLDCNYAYKDYPKLIKGAGLNKLGGKRPTKPSTNKAKSVDELAGEVIQGRWDNGERRKARLTEAGHDYFKIQTKVNEILSGRKSIDQIAREVIRGDWGNGEERRNRLTKAVYNYETVQKQVNKLHR